ncbi:MAG: purine-binding chemotaxis protein CheW [Pseudobacteriovorax sp.]|nr:purine-binding chemotaxis protein CheW [Pseudobacteriovorax sp.]
MQDNEPVDDSNVNKYLVFRLDSELYGTDLLSIREIIEPQKIKSVPLTHDYFLGVINIRGEIVGIIDLRRKFHIPAEESEKSAFVIFEIPGSQPIAALVNEVVSVLEIEPNDIDSATIESHIDQRYISGVAKSKLGLINIIELKQLIEDDEIIINREKDQVA